MCVCLEPTLCAKAVLLLSLRPTLLATAGPKEALFRCRALGSWRDSSQLALSPLAHRNETSKGMHTQQLSSLVEADHERREAVGQVGVGVECQRVGEGVDEERGAEAGVGRVGVGRKVAQAVGVGDGGVGGAVRGVRHLVRDEDLNAFLADLRAGVVEGNCRG